MNRHVLATVTYAEDRPEKPRGPWPHYSISEGANISVFPSVVVVRHDYSKKSSDLIVVVRYVQERPMGGDIVRGIKLRLSWSGEVGVLVVKTV